MGHEHGDAIHSATELFPRLPRQKREWPTAGDRQIGALQLTLTSGGRFVSEFWRWAGLRGVMAIGLSTLGAILEGSAMLLLIPVLTNLSDRPSVRPASWVEAMLNTAFQALSIDGGARQIQATIIVAATLAVARAFVVARRASVSQGLQYGFLARQQTAVIEALADAPWEVVSRLKHARISNMLGLEVQRVSAAATGMVEVAAALIVLATYLLIALSVSPLLTAAAAAVGAVAVVVMIPMAGRARRLGEFVGDGHLALIHNTGQFLGALKLARSQGLQHAFVAKFRDDIGEIFSRELTFVSRFGLARVQWTACGAAGAVILTIFAFDVLRLNAAVILPLLVLLSRLTGPALQMQHHGVELARNLPAYERMRAMLDELRPGRRAGPQEPVVYGDIELRAVSYRHARDGADAGGVSDLSLRIEEGECLGIAGRSGAGKTTFADLIAGLYPPQSGKILVAGRSVQLATAPAWPKMLAYVAQDAFLANNSLRDNLLWGAEDASDDDIREVLSIVEAEHLLARLAAGLDTFAGERGGLLSGGERQRFALARALLRRPRLLILDEATNALDIESENRLLARMRKHQPSLTIILIAHRPETLRHADRVIVIDAGGVVQQGRYADLQDQLPDLLGSAQPSPFADARHQAAPFA